MFLAVLPFSLLHKRMELSNYLITTPLCLAKHKGGKVLRAGNEGLLGHSAAFRHVSLHILTEAGMESVLTRTGEGTPFFALLFGICC